MYLYKDDPKIINNSITSFSNEIGYSRQFISEILNGKREVRKAVAYCITKAINSNANIEDYFMKVK